MRRAVSSACLHWPVLFLALGSPSLKGRPAVVLSNGKIELTVTLSGASLANLALLEDPNRFSPYWNPARAVRLADGSSANSGSLLGHFLCLDGFGAPSQEEVKAGYPFHGEASGRRFEIIQSTKVGPIASIIMASPVAAGAGVRYAHRADGG